MTLRPLLPVLALALAAPALRAQTQLVNPTPKNCCECIDISVAMQVMDNRPGKAPAPAAMETNGNFTLKELSVKVRGSSPGSFSCDEVLITSIKLVPFHIFGIFNPVDVYTAPAGGGIKKWPLEANLAAKDVTIPRSNVWAREKSRWLVVVTCSGNARVPQGFSSPLGGACVRPIVLGTCACGSGTCAPDASSGCFTYDLPIGAANAGDTTGILRFYTPDFTNPGPAGLAAYVPSSHTISRGATGAVESVTTPTTTITVASLAGREDPRAFTITHSHTGGNAFRKTTIALTGGQLRAESQLLAADGITVVSTTRHQQSKAVAGNTTTFTLESGSFPAGASFSPLRTEILAVTPDTGAGSEVHLATTIEDGATVSIVESTYHDYPWGWEKIREVTDPGATPHANLISEWSHYGAGEATGPAGTGNAASTAGYGMLKSHSRYDGHQEFHTYWENHHEARLPFAADPQGLVSAQVWEGNTLTTTRKVGNNILSEESVTYDETVPSITSSVKTSGTQALTTTTTLKPFGSDFGGQPLKTVHPDGTLTTYHYQRNGDSGKTVTTRSGSIDNPGTGGGTVTHGTTATTTYNAFGTPVMGITTLTVPGSGTVTTDSFVVDQQDAFGRAEATTRFPGTPGAHTTRATYACCGLSSSTDRHGVTATYGYDSLGRPCLETQSRTGATRTTYVSATCDAVESVTDPGGRATSFTYDPRGNRLATTHPDASVTRNRYAASGRLTATWGSLAYATVYSHDYAGRLLTLRTSPATDDNGTPTDPADDFPADSGGAVTHWQYDPATGLLTGKFYDYGGTVPNNGPTYAHTAAGRLHTRTWKRGITTAYYYGPAGDLIATDYSDTTPDVLHTRDRLGRATASAQGTLALSGNVPAVSDGTGITLAAIRSATYGYDPATLAPATEAVDYGGGFTRTLTRTYEDGANGTISGRPSGYTSTDGSATWTYDSTGRPSAVTDGTDTFAYAYQPGGDLIKTVTGPVHTVANTYEPTRDVLANIENKVGPGVKSSYTYTVNSLGQRTNLSTTGEGFAPGAAPVLVWQYDTLGQLEQADSSISGQDRSYQYDPIGNREKTVNGLLGSLPTDPNWAANGLNQYTSIPQAPATPGYDGDGNMATGPLPVSPTVNSTLVWDAENRLIEVKNGGDSLVEYTYDAQSRRIAAVVDPDGNPATTLYVYDGWNCIAEYQLQNSSFNLHASYLWGLDLSGSPQGAGGVGGLLSVRQEGAVFYPTFDGNGNVSEYLTTSGAVAAHFEYDPFGNLVVNTDAANQFEYRFSTKPQDPATGLYYYGYRWYDPLTGRWPSRDPIEEDGGLNLYGFVGNRGIGLVDAVGLSVARAKSEVAAFAAASLGTYVAKASKLNGLIDVLNAAFSNINNVYYENSSGEKAGYFNSMTKNVVLYDDEIEYLAHELVHAWNDNHTQYGVIADEGMAYAVQYQVRIIQQMIALEKFLENESNCDSVKAEVNRRWPAWSPGPSYSKSWEKSWYQFATVRGKVSGFDILTVQNDLGFRLVGIAFQEYFNSRPIMKKCCVKVSIFDYRMLRTEIEEEALTDNSKTSSYPIKVQS